jgi:HD-GYP domain-containing protein (c-di-GMP phosphodiesterase class II)
VRRHPTYSVVLLEAVEGVPEDVRLAAYQHHERENGSGYPRGLRGRAISDVARVVALADAFAAAAARRRYRAKKKPYEAIEELIRQAASGVYDRSCARALVESVGLFPVGSHVLLSNRTPAVVVGVQPEAIDRPIVRVLQRSAAGSTLGITVHLADFSRNELWIAEPIDAPLDLTATG